MCRDYYKHKRLPFALRADVLAIFAGREHILHPVIPPPEVTSKHAEGKTGNAGNAANSGAATGPGATCETGGGVMGAGGYNIPYIHIAAMLAALLIQAPQKISHNVI